MWYIQWGQVNAYPVICQHMGPGAISAFSGARIVPGEDTYWFEPERETAVADLHIYYTPDSVWLRRLKDIYAAGVARWGSLVQITMTDLGGNLDSVSPWRPGEDLLFDLYDHPEEVKRLTREAHDTWWKYFTDIDSVYRATNPGYTAWIDVFSGLSYYVLQCDFSYMIGPDMFDEFVKPELVASSRRLPNNFYHLDGVGAAKHLPALLSIPELKGLQWNPGDGRPGVDFWVKDIYGPARDAGKLLYIQCTAREMESVIDQFGGGEGVCFEIEAWTDNKTELMEFLRKHGVR